MNIVIIIVEIFSVIASICAIVYGIILHRETSRIRNDRLSIKLEFSKMGTFTFEDSVKVFKPNPKNAHLPKAKPKMHVLEAYGSNSCFNV
jgi:hypothetical protein